MSHITNASTQLDTNQHLQRCHLVAQSAITKVQFISFTNTQRTLTSAEPKRIFCNHAYSKISSQIVT
jgi:hypothetical protein